MKRLTINDIARASLRAGKRAYLSLAIGIFLSVFLVAGVAVLADGLNNANQARTARDVGWLNFFVKDNTEITDSELMETGMFSELGHVYVTACAVDTIQYVGYYDKQGAALLNRRMEEGRMPEKAGEIAVEMSALENLRIEANVGDAIELELAAVDGITETREYTVTGILVEQSKYYNTDPNGWSSGVQYFPSMLVHEDEPAFSVGRVAVHRLLKKSDNVPFNVVMNRCTRGQFANFYGIYSRDEMYHYAPSAIYVDYDTIKMYSMLLVCAAALLTAAGTGIAQAMESRLAQKREEIGMLRAVGATRRQIKRIFGRETWLLALVLSPLSVAGGCAFAWLVSQIAPEFIAFCLNWRLLLPVVLFSALCILMSASLPLRRASKIYPMSVIRDTELLRKSRAIRPKRQFSAPKLISRRQLRLYPTRQIGSILLVVMMLLCIALAGSYLDPVIGAVLGPETADFSFFNWWGIGASEFIEILPSTNITLQDIRQLEAIEQVDRVRYSSEQEILLLKDVEGLPEYVEYMDWHGYGNLHLDDDASAMEHVTSQYSLMRGLYGIDTDVIKTTIQIVDSASLAEQAKYVAEGKIDLAAVNAGREVVLYLPDVYVYEQEDGVTSSYGEPSKYHKEPWSRIVTNDIFRAGEELDLMQLWHTEDDVDMLDTAPDRYQKMYAQANRVNASVTVGALLKDVGAGAFEKYSISVVTTMEGALAMGLKVESPNTKIYLRGNVDEQTEAQIEKRIAAIAARGEQLQLRNHLETARQKRSEGLRLMAACLSAAVVFLAVAVSMIAGNIRRRILADKRMIGTLRAVGADKKALISCYGGQVESAVGGGLLISLALYGLLARGIYAYNAAGAARDVPVVAAVMLLFAAACYLCCRFSLRRSVGFVMNRSIIENIREL